jgi:hypothetical protein
MTDAAMLTRRMSPAAVVRRGWARLDRVQRGLLGLMLLRWVLALLFMLDILPLDLRYGWYLQHGGDQDIMISLSRSILWAVPEETVVAIGQPLLMLPWLVLFRAYFYTDIVVPMVLLNGFVLGGLSVLLVGGLARSLTTDRTALWSATIWAVLPLLGYVGFFWHYDWVTVRSAMVPKLGWLNGLTDGPATFYLLLATTLLARVRDRRQVGFWYLVGIGLALGAVPLFRVIVLPIAGALLVYTLLAHGWQAVLTVVGGMLLMYLPQAWYNLTVFGLPFTTGYFSHGDIANYGGTLYRPLADMGASSPFRPDHVLDNLAYFIERRPWLMVPLAAALATGGAMLVVLWRQRGWKVVMLLLAAPLTYLVPLATSWNFRDDIVRFSMPALPPLLIVGVYACLRIWDAVSAGARQRLAGSK